MGLSANRLSEASRVSQAVAVSGWTRSVIQVIRIAVRESRLGIDQPAKAV